MRILCQALRSRYSPAVEVALWEVLEPTNIGEPIAWVVTSADRDDHEWTYDSLEKALYHFNQLRDSRLNRSRARYETLTMEKPKAQPGSRQ